MATAELTKIEESPPTVSEPEPQGLYEIIDGEITEKTVGVHEVEIANELQTALRSHVKANGLGRVWMEMLFVTVPEAHRRRRRPDVSFLSADRWPLDRELPEGWSLDIAPDLSERPHSSLGYKTPAEFAATCARYVPIEEDPTVPPPPEQTHR